MLATFSMYHICTLEFMCIVIIHGRSLKGCMYYGSEQCLAFLTLGTCVRVTVVSHVCLCICPINPGASSD